MTCTLDNNYGAHTIYTLIYLTHIFGLHFIRTQYTCTYKTVHCYIPVNTIVDLYIIIPYFYYLCFCSVTVILLHSVASVTKNKFLVCVNVRVT